MFFLTINGHKSKGSRNQAVKTQKEKKQTCRRKLAGILTVVSVSVAALLAVFFVMLLNRVPSSTYIEGVGEVSLLASTESEREDFFTQFGYTAESVESSAVVIPSEGEVFEEYNDLQEEQGLSLEPYGGKKAYRYTLKLDKKSGMGNNLYGVLTVYRDKVVAVHLTDFVYRGDYLGLCCG